MGCLLRLSLVNMSQQLVRRAAAAGVASVIGQALSNSDAELKLEAAEVQDVHHIIARGQLFPPTLLAVSAKVASKPSVQAAVFEAMRQDYMLVDVPGGAAIPVLREEYEWGEGENQEVEGAPQQHRQREDGKENEGEQRLSLSSSASAPSALSSLRQRRGMNSQLAPIGSQPLEGELAVPLSSADQEAVFELAERRLRKWGNAWQPAADNQLSSTSTLSSPHTQQSARVVPVDVVTPIDDAAGVVTPLPPIELESPLSAAVAPQPAAKPGMLEWLLQWLDSKISGLLGVLIPSSSSSSIASSSSSSAPQDSAAVPYRLEASNACADSSPSAASASSSSSSSAPSSSSSVAMRGTQVVAGVAAVVIVLALLRRHSPALFALMAKLLQG